MSVILWRIRTGEISPRMELSSDPVVAALDMSQVKSKEDDEPFDSDGDYESLPPHVSVATHMTAGAVAGILEHTVMYPVDSVKALKRIIQTEGVLRPLRGLNITMIGAGPAHAIYFACYERVKRSLSDVMQSKGNSHLANGLAGSVATVLHDAVMNPAEGLWDCVQTVTRKEGLGAFYRSYSTQLTMNIPFQAVHFMIYELMQEQLNPHRHYHPGSHIVSGAAAGAISAAITTPLDVCKTLLNTQENVALSSVNVSGQLSGMANTFRTVYRLGGLPAFFKGAQARIIYQMPSTAIAWSVYEFFKYFLTKQQMEHEAGPRSRK
ncbi:hypothetical protein F7725_012509 [Dissostichus mawsoni]|uniref:Mitoferrin-1 n=1 Tax=Dissostichus mawsoni TaxID=36200 RepID=A0A7J5YQR1_DISMA|nr:hypothetical protein F7725_012509 [Dissostichus mawsoni]